MTRLVENGTPPRSSSSGRTGRRSTHPAELVDKEIVTAPRLADLLAETTGRGVALAESGIEAPEIPAAPTEVPVAA